MRFALSPYEVGAGGVAAATAVLLGAGGGGVVTLRPGPFEEMSAEAVRGLVATAPSYARLLELWRWTGPLWRAGVLRAAYEGRGLAEALARMSARLRADGELRAVSRLLVEHGVDDESGFLEAFSRDCVRGGVDPSVSLPIIALIEEMAVREGAAVVCGESAGMAWRGRRGEDVNATASMPVVEGADGELLVVLIERMRPALERLSGTLAEATGAGRDASEVEVSAHAYEAAFAAAWNEDLARGSRARAARVVLTLSRVQRGAAVREAALRVAAMMGVGAERGAGATTALAEAADSFVVVRVRKSAWDY